MGDISRILIVCLVNLALLALGQPIRPVGPVGAIDADAEKFEGFPHGQMIELSAVKTGSQPTPACEVGLTEGIPGSSPLTVCVGLQGWGTSPFRHPIRSCPTGLAPPRFPRLLS